VIHRIELFCFAFRLDRRSETNSCDPLPPGLALASFGDCSVTNLSARTGRSPERLFKPRLCSASAASRDAATGTRALRATVAERAYEEAIAYLSRLSRLRA